MPLYRERPPVVEAFQASDRRVVRTIDGDVVIAQGDYLVRSPNGQCTVIPRDVFERRYEQLTRNDANPTCRCCGRRGPCVCLERGQVLALCGRCPDCCTHDTCPGGLAA